MPAISVFFGIVIRMFFKDHDPPHFHAEYQGERGTFDLAGRLLAGNMRSRTALRLVRQWARLHETDVRANWQRAKAGLPLQPIEPLR